MIDALRENPRIIFFGLLTAFFSGPGQSFLISFFAPGMLDEFGIGTDSWGYLYMTATLAGALALPYMGRLLDSSEIMRFALTMGLLLAAGCFVLGISQNLWMAGFGLILIRCFGQGGMSLVSNTTISRSFGKSRGRALGLTSQGYPLGEALLPLIITAWIAQHGWRSGWFFLAIALLLVFSPSAFFLLRKAPNRKPSEKQKKEAKHASRNLKLFSDYRFYFAIVMSITAAASLTGLFLFQTQIAEFKGWSLQIMAQAFVAFAMGRALMSFLAGFVVDRFTATKLLGLVLLPLALGVGCLVWGQNELWAFAYLGLAGLSVGAGANVKTSFWAEAYGVKALGSVKGTTALFMILATALSPAIFGEVLARDVSVQFFLQIIFGYILFGSALGFFCSFLYKSKKRHG